MERRPQDAHLLRQHPAWINYDLSEHVGALIDHAVPVVVENDANCAGWGEYVHGAGQGSSNMSP